MFVAISSKVIQVLHRLKEGNCRIVSPSYQLWNDNNMSKILDSQIVGKHTQSAYYVHKSAISNIDPLLQRIISRARRKALSSLKTYNVVKIHRRDARVSFLNYPDFDNQETPSLRGSVVVNLRTGEVKGRSYGVNSEPPILHKKELLVQGETMRNPTTAIARTNHSMPFGIALENGLVESPALDWGCGKGADLRALRDMGEKAAGYDPKYQPRKPTRKSFYRYGHVIYVVNTIPDSQERVDTLVRFKKHLARGASWLVAVRSKKAIDKLAAENQWERHKDGYRTGSGTFQKGYSKNGLASLLKHVGFKNFDIYRVGDSVIAHTPVKKSKNPKKKPFEEPELKISGELVDSSSMSVLYSHNGEFPVKILLAEDARDNSMVLVPEPEAFSDFVDEYWKDFSESFSLHTWGSFIFKEDGGEPESVFHIQAKRNGNSYENPFYTEDASLFASGLKVGSDVSNEVIFGLSTDSRTKFESKCRYLIERLLSHFLPDSERSFDESFPHFAKIFTAIRQKIQSGSVTYLNKLIDFNDGFVQYVSDLTGQHSEFKRVACVPLDSINESLIDFFKLAVFDYRPDSETDYHGVFFDLREEDESPKVRNPNPLVMAGNPAPNTANCDRIKKFVEGTTGWLIYAKNLALDPNIGSLREVADLIDSARYLLSANIPECDSNLEGFHRAYHEACRKIQRAIMLENQFAPGHKVFVDLKEISTEIHEFDKWMHSTQGKN